MEFATLEEKYGITAMPKLDNQIMLSHVISAPEEGGFWPAHLQGQCPHRGYTILTIGKPNVLSVVRSRWRAIAWTGGVDRFDYWAAQRLRKITSEVYVALPKSHSNDVIVQQMLKTLLMVFDKNQVGFLQWCSDEKQGTTLHDVFHRDGPFGLARMLLLDCTTV
jgi:hypothetical protein